MPLAGAGEWLCTFCGRHKQQVNDFIAGPDANICNACVDRVHVVLATPGTTVSTRDAAIRQVSNAGGGESCSFCGKRRHRVEAMAAAGDARICSECLDLCDEIIADNLA